MIFSRILFHVLFIDIASAASIRGASSSSGRSMASPVSPARKLLSLSDGANEKFLSECEGDCDVDSDCIGDLICYQRYQTETVPGCEGDGVAKRDYCAYRPPDYLLYVGNDLGVGAYGLCEGDCDSDEDCIDDLKCFQRSGTTPVEGCRGVGRRSSDYCYSEDPVTPPGPGPSKSPSKEPTNVPTPITTAKPTNEPTVEPTNAPSTANPTAEPTNGPSTANPTPEPTANPTTAQPTYAPTNAPTNIPTNSPSLQPTSNPTIVPTSLPSSNPTSNPTAVPTSQPTSNPTDPDIINPPTPAPTNVPTSSPSQQPTSQPTKTPSSNPTAQPTSIPTRVPSALPSTNPTSTPSAAQPTTSNPTTVEPSNAPTASPTKNEFVVTRIPAVNWDEQSGTTNEGGTNVGFITNGNYMKYDNVNFGGVGSAPKANIIRFAYSLSPNNANDGGTLQAAVQPFNNPSPQLTYVADDGSNAFGSQNFPLEACQGDCDTDADCSGPGLYCYQRDTLEDVPGCSGEASSGSGKDYCAVTPTLVGTFQPASTDSWSNYVVDTFFISGFPEGVQSLLFRAETNRYLMNLAWFELDYFPTANPTAVPTNAPSTLEPTNAPSTARPTVSPTPEPTVNPASTLSPTSVETLACPPIGTSITTSAGLKQVTIADPNTYCGIFLHRPSGDLIPLARSYNAEDWESAPGPLACPSEDVGPTSVLLPQLEDPEDSYVILSKEGSMEDRSSIAKFLEMTTFGPKKSEIESLEADWSTFGSNKRATYIREQMDLPATSHREYWRRRTNTKWDRTSLPARSDHPCSPNSRWRRYTYIRKDRYDDSSNNLITFTADEINSDVSIYEADRSSDVNKGSGSFKSRNAGWSGTGYYDFGEVGDFLEFTVNMDASGTYPLSFRYSLLDSGYGGHRPLQLYVNDIMILNTYDFVYTKHEDSFKYNWIYSELVQVDFTSGSNRIRLVADQNPGPHIDHLRIGKPPAIALSNYGSTRTIVPNGLRLLNDWSAVSDFNNLELPLDGYPDPPQGDIKKWNRGRLEPIFPSIGGKRLDSGNPFVNFTGYEEYLPPNVFYFDENDTFEETASDMYPYPMQRGLELILTNGFDGPVCDSVPKFVEKYDAPIIGRLPSGEWLQWTPTIQFQDNGPSMNDVGDMTANVLSDGGGSFAQETTELRCSNVPRSFINEETCFLSTESTACSSWAGSSGSSIYVPMNKANIIEFYTLVGKYVYAIRGLRMEEIQDHACRKTASRWEIQHNTTCSDPTSLSEITRTALMDAFDSSTDTNEFTRDVERVQACDPEDETLEKINIEIQVGDDCYTHVHLDHLNVYDFSGWATGTNHPGGAYNIQKWAEDPNFEGWHLDFPCRPNASGDCDHVISRWDVFAKIPNIVYVARLGSEIRFKDLPINLQLDDVAEYFDAGVVVCGSRGEVSNDPSLAEYFDVHTNYNPVIGDDEYNNQKSVVWTEVVLKGDDQLRQRMAWALAQILTVVPIPSEEQTEMYLNYYDILVKHAFGNYRDILAEASFNPLMGEHLTFLNMKSHAYTYKNNKGQIARADENYAREIMQLFTIGVFKLHDDGTPVIDSESGNPVDAYTNDDIESLSRAWTGFKRYSRRSNIETNDDADNRLDPMFIEADYRDAFPKSNLDRSYIGDGYMLCTDLPAQSFLKKGAGYRLLGGKTSPELMNDPSYFDDDNNNILRVQLDPASPLYKKLYNSGNYQVFVELDTDLVCTPNTVECDVDTLRVVQVSSVYYEFVERPCVQQAFYNDGKQIQLRDNTREGSMCANPSLPHAREACCNEDNVDHVRYARMETGVTNFYDGERMTYATAQNRCLEAYDRGLCLFEKVTLSPTDDDNKKGYHWTNKSCEINVKVDPEGAIAIVHDAVITYQDNVPLHVREDTTLNYFGVFWDNGDYPGSTETNTCEVNKCKPMTDGNCLCKTTVTDSVVFTDMSVSKEDVMTQLFIGALSPHDGSVATNLENGVTVHTVGGVVDEVTVFEVRDKGRTRYLKNILSTVSLQGWEMTPRIYEAEDATINNAPIRGVSSASEGAYVEAKEGSETTYIEWEINDVPTSGDYLVSFRYANDANPRPLNVFVNDQKIVLQPSPNTPIPLTYFGGSPTSSYPLQRCQGDCDNDGHCAESLICQQRDNNEIVVGCTGTPGSSEDFCVDIADFEPSLSFLPTGGWSADWHLSEQLTVSLIAGQVNTIRVQVLSASSGPNIDYMKVEGLPTSSPSPSFRNPPHFMSLITDYYSNSSPGGLGEQNKRDAYYETNAVLDHYFYQDNVAPFLCVRIMQRFGFSNPSGRYISTCVKAFRTGMYESGSQTFGSGDYGSLEAMAAAIFLDKEATDNAVASDPSYGSMKEPVLKMLHLMRSMEYSTHIPTTLDGNPMQTTYSTKLWQIADKIGHGPFEFPSVFSFFASDYVADSGPAHTAKLTSPETSLVTMPSVLKLLNGMFSLIKYGLSDCRGGLSTFPGYGGCNEDGLYERSYGHLFYEPEGNNDYERAADLALLLTSSRLSTENINMIVDSCSVKTDLASKTRCMQQLIVTTGEFHSTSSAKQSGEDRAAEVEDVESEEPYKAIVYLYLNGGVDSYSMLAPRTCAPIDVYQRYTNTRGSVALTLDKQLEINGNNLGQPCQTFGIHQNLPALKSLYDQGELIFVANAGFLVKPVTSKNYRETPLSLFGHSSMSRETLSDDLYDEFGGTGVGGRIADVLTQKKIPTDTFSIRGQTVLLAGSPGQGPAQYIIGSDGLPSFNDSPSLQDMEEKIKALNNATTPESGVYAETWSSKLTESLAKQKLLKQELDATQVTTTFPGGKNLVGVELEMVTRLMQTREMRKSKRDIFYVQDGNGFYYDHHSSVNDRLSSNFQALSSSIDAFVNEVKLLGLWDNVVVVQFTEFGRTLRPNSSSGTDHGWGGHHFMFGGGVAGGKVLGQYPTDFEQGDDDKLVIGSSRIIPSHPWDSMWKGTAEWFGVQNGAEMEKVLPMHVNFPENKLYSKDDLFDSTSVLFE